MHYRILGGLGVADGDRELDLGGPKQRAVLAALLVELGRPVSAERLADLVWGEAPPTNPDASLQAYVSNLRRVLEPDRPARQPARVLVTRPAGYCLVVERAEVDAARFEDLVVAGQAALGEGDAAQAAELLDEALGTWAGAPLPELAAEDWVAALTARLDTLRAQAMEDRADAGLALGQHREAIPPLEAAIAEHPYRERLRALYALALYRAGRQRDSLEAIASARKLLAEDIGIEPGAELRQLEADVLAQSPTLDLSTSTRRVEEAEAPPAPSRPAATFDSARTAGRPFVGRDDELSLLLDAATKVRAGLGGRAVVVSGEPGIGKTRVVEEAVAEMADLTVAWSRCPESAGAAAYWAVAQVGRQLDGAGVLDEEMLTAMLPDEGRTDLDGGAASDRLSLHLEIVRLLRAAARPLVIVLDDLQWADPASLRVIEFVAGELQRLPILLVVTVRPVNADAPAPLIDCLGELARVVGSLRVDLAGLKADDVAQWIHRRSDGSAEPRVAAVVHARTGGNPFFVGEVVELLAGEGRLADADAAARGSTVPAAVQDVVRRRISRLPVDTQQLLAAASVVGHSFDVDVLGAVVGDTPAEVLDLLDPAAAAGLVIEGDVPGRFQFAHALVGETLSSEISAARRARLHAATATALAALRALTIDEHLADLAHHAIEGAPAGTAGAAYGWSVRAARQAALQAAPEDAATHWTQALRALDLARPADREARYDVLLELGCARVKADDINAGFVALVGAIEMAESLGDPERMVQAALPMYISGFWQAGEIDFTTVDVVAALERVLAAMPAEPSPERALLLAAMSDIAYWRLPVERLDDISAEAVATARQIGDVEVLGRALHKRNQTLWRAATMPARRAAADEAATLVADPAISPELRADAEVGIASVCWDLGDVAAARGHMLIARDLAERLSSAALLPQSDYFLGAIAAFKGDLAAAGTLMEGANSLYRRTRRWEADAIYMAMVMIVWFDQGRISDIDANSHLVLESPYGPWFGEGYATVLVEQGRLEEAAHVVRAGLPPLIDCWMYPGILALAAQVRTALGDVESSLTLRQHLAPYAGRLACCGTGPAIGDIDLALARIERLLGDEEAALRHANASVDLLARAGAGPYLVRSLLLRAQIDPSQAYQDRERASEIIERLDLPSLRRQLEAAR